MVQYKEEEKQKVMEYLKNHSYEETLENCKPQGNRLSPSTLSSWAKKYGIMKDKGRKTKIKDKPYVPTYTPREPISNPITPSLETMISNILDKKLGNLPQSNKIDVNSIDISSLVKKELDKRQPQEEIIIKKKRIVYQTQIVGDPHPFFLFVKKKFGVSHLSSRQLRKDVNYPNHLDQTQIDLIRKMFNGISNMWVKDLLNLIDEWRESEKKGKSEPK